MPISTDDVEALRSILALMPAQSEGRSIERPDPHLDVDDQHRVDEAEARGSVRYEATPRVAQVAEINPTLGVDRVGNFNVAERPKLELPPSLVARPELARLQDHIVGAAAE